MNFVNISFLQATQIMERALELDEEISSEPNQSLDYFDEDECNSPVVAAKLRDDPTLGKYINMVDVSFMLSVHPILSLDCFYFI